jgi:micrococcal nuclease
VSLGYDNVRLDRYGRTLAGVTTADGMLVNAEIARAGLGVPVEFDGNVRYLDPVEDAWDEAASARRGLLDPQRDCTISGRVEDVEAARAALPGLTSAESSSAEQLEAAATRAATVAATARAIYDGFNGPSSAKVWAALSPTDRARLQTRARFVADAAAGAESFFRTTAGQARTRETAPQSPPQTHVTGPPTAVTPPAARVATPKPTTPKPATPRPAPPATRTAPSGGGSGCQPGYSPCVPLYPPDLDCSDLAGPYTVTGSDPHRLDADKDGKGCE